ncbi:unnamed protein product [Protopolystoma xenopodis]|uniref:Small monomeric GTPase n=1 Tax=Protopolystoma xenopodis TaxID=117903 RepID=A0A3S4ZCB7_9PLAT|nr:unnamed protein product [Protopolystoma xenopodis]
MRVCSLPKLVINCNKQVCTLEITDTTGSHQFPAMQRLSISKGHAFLLVYSVTSKSSLEDLNSIYTELTRIKAAEFTRVPVMLVGNKCDENEAREVSQPQGQAIAKRWKCGFMETSAKLNQNVKEMFQDLLQMETRRNMTLVGEVKQESGLRAFFRRQLRVNETSPALSSSKNGSVPGRMEGKINFSSKKKENQKNTVKESSKQYSSPEDEVVNTNKKCSLM